MRKSLTLTLLLLILAAGSFGYIHASVDERKDAVTIDETVLYGDKSIAKGITLDFNIHSNYRLFWDTSYTVGDSPKLNTTFTFSQVQRQPERPGPAFEIHLNGLHSGGSTSAGSLDMEAEHIPLPIRDVATRTQPGKKHTEIVFVEDYYDFYPLAVEFERPSGFAINQDTLNLFANYFKIPVHPKHQVDVTVEKDVAGNVYRTDLSIRGTEVYTHATSVVTDSYCFFIFSCYTTDGELLDTSNIPGGYGIYRFPRHTESGVHILTADELETVFPLDAKRERAIALETSQDRTKLLLVTEEASAYMLTVIDAITMTELQKLRIMDADIEPGPWYPRFGNLYIYEDFIVPVSGSRFALLTSNAVGRYEVQFEASLGLDEVEGLKYIFSRGLTMDYNGEELAVAAFQDGYYRPRNYCSFYLAVYSDLGLAYAGHYQHSLDKSSIDEYKLICRPLEGEPLRVTWGD